MTELEALVSLNMTNEIGSIRMKKLLEYFSSYRKIISASEDVLCRVDGIGRVIAQRISDIAKKHNLLKKEIELIKKHDIKLLTLDDSDYPLNLKEIYDPPPLLYVKGNLTTDQRLAVAIVGSRRASYYGLTSSEKFAYELASLGLIIVSGMARGIDTHAHRGAIKANGRTIAVLGSGLNCIYPPENKELFQEIARSSAVISEFSMNTKPLPGNFPRRNRIISGLSLGVLVIEANRNSGALITADFALEQGREVFALPGKIDSSGSFGTHELIKQGAKLITCVEDIVEELNIHLKEIVKEDKEFACLQPNLNEEESLIYNSLSTEPRNIEELFIEHSIPAQKIMSVLLNLEIRHLVKQLPGRMFVRSALG